MRRAAVVLVGVFALAGCTPQPPLPIRAWQSVHLTATPQADADDEPVPVWLWGGPCRLKFNREILEFIELTRDDAEIAPLYRGVRWRLLRRVTYPRHTFRGVVKRSGTQVVVYAVTSGAMPTKEAFFDGTRWFDPDNCAELLR